ncbi:MAG: hypothetical protein H8E48_00135, partial [Chloroflexi bacterium]|nr:hypothetical protein [Chloroflexota bacterium]
MAKQTSSPKRGRGRPKAFAGQARLKAAVVRVVKEEGKLGPARDRLAKGILVPRTGPQAKVV